MAPTARSGTGRQPGVPVTGLTIDRGQSDPDRWPYTVPAVRQVYESGLTLAPGATVLIGANGAGKSTLVEAIAAAWARRVTAFREDWLQRSIAEPAAEDSDLHRALRLSCTRGGPTGGLFLRAERLHAQAHQFSGRGRWSERIDGPLLGRSHGEGFLQVLALQDMLAAGSQVVLATHSPVLAALPGATLLQLDDEGITPVEYDDCDLVTSWRAFLDRPAAFLRHLS